MSMQLIFHHHRLQYPNQMKFIYIYISWTHNKLGVLPTSPDVVYAPVPPPASACAGGTVWVPGSHHRPSWVGTQVWMLEDRLLHPSHADPNEIQLEKAKKIDENNQKITTHL